MSELTYSNAEELRKLALTNGFIVPSQKKVEDSNIPLIEDGFVSDTPEQEDEGAIIAEKIRQFGGVGYRPTLDEALKYREFMRKQETSAWAMIGAAIEQTASDLGSAALNLVGDTMTLKLPKVAGSVVEGAALGTKNWYYMWEEAKYNEDSPVHKLLYNKTASNEDYYFNLMKTMDVRQAMEKDINEGILLPREVDVGGYKFDLWNPATVMGISYVADPSWVMPNLGIESTLTKGLRGASKIMALNEQMAKVSAWSAKQAEIASGKVADFSQKVSKQIVKNEEALLNNLKEATGVDAFIGTSGNIVDKNDLGRGAMSAAGLNAVKIPAWGATTLAWGASKIVETAASATQLAAKIAQEPTTQFGLRMSERLAMQSENASVRALAGTWAKTGSPLVEWAGQTARTSLHSAMYGGAFGFTFGGEEGFYNGIGSGFTIGGAFHQIGAIHGAVAGADAPREVIKNFLWATDGYDYYSKEGVIRLLDNAQKEFGDEAKLKIMSQIAASERLQRDVKRVILTEERIKQILGEDSPEWQQFKELSNNSPDFGGLAFQRTLDGQKVVIINADRAHRFAANEELFHTLLMDSRYGMEFHRYAMDNLVGSEDARGALYRMPKEDAVRMLYQFRDAYLGVEDKASNGDPERISKTRKDFDEVIEKFKNGEQDGRLNRLFEEFLASYWVAYVEDKPIDYLLKGGDLGLVRNIIETAKDAYKNTMHQDLRSAGAKFEFGKDIDGFFIDQKTGKRIVIPELEKMMKHFVDRSRKEMYSGWVQNQRKISGVETALSKGLDHLVVRNADGSSRLMTPEEANKQIGRGLKSAIEKISELKGEDRGLQFIRVGSDGESKGMFSPAKKPKKTKKPKPKKSLLEEDADTTALDYSATRRYNKHWDEQAEALAEEDKTPITKKELKEAESIAGDPTDEIGGWSIDKKKKFWKSVWEGNPRIKIKGVATKKELAILEEFLPYHVVNRFKHLNAVIEMSRMGKFAGGVSNVLTAEVITDKKGPYNKVSLREEGPFAEQRNFTPVEINIYFERKRFKEMEDGEESIRYESGEPFMLAKVVDHDALLTRVDYFFDEVKGDLNFKEVRRLFESKEDLYIAAKSLLSRYSNSEYKEGGIAIFRANGAVSARDAGRMRTIVNGVLGIHPTKAQMRAGEYSNPWHDLQIRKKSEEADLPAVVKDFRVDRIGHMRARDGEGFYIDWDNAHQRSQYNFSPAKSFRDHEGNPMNKAELLAVKNSVYRNREGEVLAVYSLNKALSTRKKASGSTVFQYVDEGMGTLIDSVEPRMRGRQFYSDSGWLHYTPDMSEASLLSKGSMVTGYIDTTRHLDISSIPYNSTPDLYIQTIAEGMSRITGRQSSEHLKELLNIRDINGNKLSSLLNGDVSPTQAMSENIETFLFTKEMAKYFKKNDIHSLEYVHYNPIRDMSTSAVALWDNGRFIENRARRAEANYFAFSPAKKREILPNGDLAPKSMLDILDKKISAIRAANIAKGMSPDEAALEAFMAYKVDEDGISIVENSKRITEKQIQEIISTEIEKYEKILGKELGDDFFDYEGRKKINEKLKPFVMKSLRKAMPFAPNVILSQISDIALNGIASGVISTQSLKAKPIGEKGRGRTKDYDVITDTVLGRFKKHYQMTAEKINNGYKNSLFRAVEMSEQEFRITQKFPEFLDAVRNGTQREWFKNNLEAVHEIFGEFGGAKKFHEMLLSREKDIFLLMEKGLQQGMEDTKGNKFNILNHQALKEIYAERTRQTVFEILKENKLSLMERSDMIKTYQKYRNIAAESAELRSKFRAYNDYIDAFLKDEFRERVIDTLTALEIDVKPDSELMEKVRAAMYDDAKKGLVPLGSYEAISNSVAYYYDLANQGDKGKIIDTKKALQKNLLKSLADLESAGFTGISFSKLERPHDIIDGKKVFKEHAISLVDRNGINKDTIYARNVWNFDGTYFKVIEQNHPDINNIDKSVIKLIDTRTGREVLTEVIDKEDTTLRNAEVNQFLRQATARMHQEVPSTALNTHFGLVDGPLKSYILINHQLAEYNASADTMSPLFTDWSDYDLYKNGNYFVAIRKWNKEGSDQNTKHRIETLKEELRKGYTMVKKKSKGKEISVRQNLSLEDMVSMREKITELQGRLNKDKGIILEVDEIGRVTKIGSPSTLLEQSQALSALRKGTLENHALRHYVTELFGDYVKLENRKRKEQSDRIAEILSEGEEGNIAKIKKLEKRIRDSETEFKTLIGNKIREMNKDMKKAGIDRDVTAMEAYRRIMMDLDSLRKNSDNAMKRLTALEKVLWDEGAFPEYDGMSSEQKRIFEERIQNAGEEEWVKNPLTGKMEFIKSNWVQQNVARLPNESRMDYAIRLRNEYAKQRNLHSEYSTRYEQLSEIVDRKKSAVFDVEEELVFLVRQYGMAKGIQISEKNAMSLIQHSKVNDETANITTINIGALKKFSGKKVEPQYLPDREGVLPDKKGRKGIPERGETIEDIRKIFANVLAGVSSNWHGMKDSVTTINTIIERTQALRARGVFKEARPLESDFESPRQFREALEGWQSRKAAYESNYLQILGTIESWSTDRKTGLDKKQFQQRPNKQVNERIKKLMQDELGEWNAMLAKAMRLARQDKNNLEFNFSTEFEALMEGNTKLSARQEGWVRDPMNRERVQELNDAFSRGEISEQDLIRTIQNEAYLTAYGEEGVELTRADEQLQLTRVRIAELMDRIDSIEFGKLREQYDPNFVYDKKQAELSIAKIEEKLKELRQEEDALNTRIDSIIAGVERVTNLTRYERALAQRQNIEGELKYKQIHLEELMGARAKNENENTILGRERRKAQEELKSLIQRRDQLDLEIARTKDDKPMSPEERQKAEVDRKSSLFNSEEFRNLVDRVVTARKADLQKEIERVRRNKERAELAVIWAEDYKKFIDMFREDAKELGISDPNIVVSVNNPRTRHLFNAFPRITYDLYGSVHPLDWSGSGYDIGYTEKGEQIVRFRGGNDAAGLVSANESASGRRLYTVADYMYFARRRAEYHMQNPDAPMSADDYLLITQLVPKSRYEPTEQKIATINKMELGNKRRLANGILDSISIPENRAKFVRTFIKDGLSLVMDSKGERLRALKRLSGMDDEQWNNHLKGKTEDEILKAASTREVIENAFYWITDGFVPLSETSKKTVVFEKADGKKVSIKTQNMDIQRLIEFEEFASFMDEELSAAKLDSLFDSMPYAKAQYEMMAPEERMMLDAGTINTLALNNNAEMLRYQREQFLARGEKPVWFADRFHETKHTGRSTDSMVLEQERIGRLISETAATEASIQKYKGAITTFQNKRPRAVQHMLSLKDNLHFPDLTFREKDGIVTQSESWKESADGRYIIQRHATEKKGVAYRVYFIGETVKNKDGATIFEIPTTQLGNFSDLTQAQIMVRFYEDDVHRIKQTATYLQGGEDAFSHLRVGDQLVVRDGAGAVLKSAWEAPNFSNAVIKLYQKAKGKPENVEDMKRVLRPLYDFGETQRIRFMANGEPRTKEYTITPSREGILSKYFDRTVQEDGIVLWVQKPRSENADANADVTNSREPSNNAPEVKPSTNTTPDGLPQPDKVDNMVADASQFSILSNTTKDGQRLEQWEVIRNRLGYQIVRMKDATTKRDIFKLFNPTSTYLGQYYDEIEAVDQILQQEFVKLYGNE